MLKEALASIDAADQVIVADDGSDFDPWPLIEKTPLRKNASVIYAPKMTAEERMVTPSCGRNINQALKVVTCEYVAVLCDDDLFAPNWLQAAANYLDNDAGSHMVRGSWHKFDDGQPISSAVPCVFDFELELTTGNFVHRTSCTTGCGCWWDESTIACHDAAFLGNYLRMHGSTSIAHVGVLAGYRREHDFNMLKWMDPHGRNGYRPEAEAVLGGRLEP